MSNFYSFSFWREKVKAKRIKIVNYVKRAFLLSYYTLNAVRSTLVNTKCERRYMKKDKNNFLTLSIKYGKFKLVQFYLLLGEIINETKNSFSL